MRAFARGLFTKAYKLNETHVMLVSQDPAKECLSLGWMPSSRLTPHIVRINYRIAEAMGAVVSGREQVYVMHMYNPVKSVKQLTARDKYIYKTISSVQRSSNHRDLRAAIDAIKDDEIRDYMNDSLDALRNYGDGWFLDVSKRNVSVDSEGGLVLRDIWANQAYVNEIMKQKRVG